MIQDLDRPDTGTTPPKMGHIADAATKALPDFVNVSTDDNLCSGVDVRGSFDADLHKIWQNSRFFVFSMTAPRGQRYYDPRSDPRVTVELLSRHHELKTPFRKSTTTPDKAVERIRKWIEKNSEDIQD
jgi:hypothetical protein